MLSTLRNIRTGKWARSLGYVWMAGLLIFYAGTFREQIEGIDAGASHNRAEQRNFTAVVAGPSRSTQQLAARIGIDQRYRPVDLVAIPGEVKYNTSPAQSVRRQLDVTFTSNRVPQLFPPTATKFTMDHAPAAVSTLKAWPYKKESDTGQIEKLSPYDGLVRKYANKYGFDWLLIVAQMYQESQFDPGALSYAGAEGLMQLMPATANSIGAGNLADPESNIRSGIKYLSLLRSQLETDLFLEERVWFLLASYNAGLGRVNLARRKAEKMGLDPNRWFGNVEKAMLSLAQPVEKDGVMVRNCRCGQTVVYVKKIRRLYYDYVRLALMGQVVSASELRSIPYDI